MALTLLEREKDFPTTWYEALGVDRLAQQLHAQPTPNLIRRWTTHLSRNAPHLLFPFLSALEALLLKEPLNKLKGNLRHWTVRPIHLMSAYLLGVREGSQASLELVVGVGEWMESRERVSFYLFSLWVRVWSGMMTSCSQWEGQLQTALESG